MHVKKGRWAAIEYVVPAMEGVLLDEMGFAFEIGGENGQGKFTVFLDDLYADGMPSYSIDFKLENMEVWTPVHREVSQFTRLKGNLYLEEGKLHLSCADFGEAYTGRYDWSDYSVHFRLTPYAGEHHYGCIRIQGGCQRVFCRTWRKGRVCHTEKYQERFEEAGGDSLFMEPWTGI